MATRWLYAKEEMGYIFLWSPFNRKAAEIFKSMGGFWTDALQAWKFRPEQKLQLARHCEELWGTHPWEEPKLVDSVVNLDSLIIDKSDFSLMGRPILKRWAPTQSVQPSELVRIVSGTFPATMPSGAIGEADEVVLHIYEVPEDALNMLDESGLEYTIHEHIPATSAALVRSKTGKKKVAPKKSDGAAEAPKVAVPAYHISWTETVQIAKDFRLKIDSLSDMERNEIYKILFE